MNANLSRHRRAAGLVPLWAAAALAMALAAGCSVSDQPNWMVLPQLNPMLYSSAAESQMAAPGMETGHPVFANGQNLQVPPLGTIPRGYHPDHYAATPEGAKLAGVQLTNPVPPTAENLARGAARFAIFCSPCHGSKGMGDGETAKKGIPGLPIGIPGVPAAKFPDGHIFHVITHGRNLMGGYASQIDAEDRWKIIHHLRVLQGTLTAPTTAGGGAK